MIRIALYDKEPKTLKVKVEYDELTIGKIKKIPGRKYRKNEDKIWTIPYKYVGRFVNMFDQSELIIEPGVDINYEDNDKYDFEKEIKLFNDDKFRTFARYVLTKAPDYFFTVSAATKYYPSYCLSEEGLVNHTIATIKLAHTLSVIHNLTDEEHDVLLMASLMHDFYKFGTEGVIEDDYALFEHPLLCTEEFQKIFDNEYEELNTDIKYVYNMYWSDISACIKSHKGQWNTKEGKDTKLPKPKTKLQKLLHECNYLASRGYININIR